MGAWEFITTTEKEPYAKMVMIYLIYLSSDKDNFPEGLIATAEDIAHGLGLSKQAVWRSQSILKKAGALNLRPSYSSETGKKEYDTYEIIL